MPRFQTSGPKGRLASRPRGHLLRHLGRILPSGLVVAACLATSGAQAQYGPFGPFDRAYRDPHGWWAPPPAYRTRPPIIVQRPIPPRVMAGFLRDEGLVQIDRLERLDDVYIAHGRDRQGRRLRLVADAYDGLILDRMRLSEPPRERVRPAPRRERPSSPPAARPVPEPGAPAQRPPQPPPRPPEAKPAEQAPAASPPQAPVPGPAQAKPPPANPGAANPASGGAPPVKVPDLPPPAIPVQPLDDTPSVPRPATPAVPAAPLL